MIAIKLYGENAQGIPAEWPAEVMLDVQSLPSGFDLLMQDVDELAAYKVLHQSEYDAWQESQSEQIPVPESITPAQLNRWLILNSGPSILETIDAMIAAIPDDTQRAIITSDWNRGVVRLRSDPMIVQFGMALGFTASDIDRAFREGSQL